MLFEFPLTSPGATTTVTINSALYPVGYNDAHWVTIGQAEDGSIKTWDHGVDVNILSFDIRADNTLWDSLRALWKDDTKGKFKTFQVTPDTGHDLGAGADTLITVRFWMDTLASTEKINGYYIVPIVLRREVA